MEPLSQLQEFLGRQIFTHHCIIHQQVLCGKVIKFYHVITIVVSTVKYLCSRESMRLFKAFLEEVGAKYNDLVYCIEVRWLSWGKVLQILYLWKINISISRKCA